MGNPIGNELVAVTGVSPNGALSSVNEYFTVAQLSGAGFYNVRTISNGTSDVASLTDNLIAWNSATASPKTETIPAPTTVGDSITIKDKIGTAGTYNITITPVSGTIDYSASFVLSSNYNAVTLVADGISNWMVI